MNDQHKATMQRLQADLRARYDDFMGNVEPDPPMPLQVAAVDVLRTWPAVRDDILVDEHMTHAYAEFLAALWWLRAALGGSPAASPAMTGDGES